MRHNSSLPHKLLVSGAVATAAAGIIGIVETSIGQENEPIRPVPIEVKLDARKVVLGDRLFHDKRLSKDNTVSCASCHDLKLGGTDRVSFSTGVGGAKGLINSPTVFNSSLNFRQHWDGRASTLEEQVAIPLHSPRAMGSNWAEVIGKLGQDREVVTSFKDIYRDGLQANNIADAIATYERSLITPNARFDRYLRGDKQAINAEELRGYQLFKSYGCVACHQGVNVGGNMFQRFGVMSDYLKTAGGARPADLGRFNVTKNDADRHVFKVPSLRNIALTAPYFHDGSAATLEEAVSVMVKYQLGRSAPEEHKQLIVKFLHTLTGEYRGELLR